MIGLWLGSVISTGRTSLIWVGSTTFPKALCFASWRTLVKFLAFGGVLCFHFPRENRGTNHTLVMTKANAIMCSKDSATSTDSLPMLSIIWEYTSCPPQSPDQLEYLHSQVDLKYQPKGGGYRLGGMLWPWGSDVPGCWSSTDKSCSQWPVAWVVGLHPNTQLLLCCLINPFNTSIRFRISWQACYHLTFWPKFL